MLDRNPSATDLPLSPAPGAPDDQGNPDDSTLVGRTLPGGLRVLHRVGSTPEGVLYQAQYLTGMEVGLLVLRSEGGMTKRATRDRWDRAMQIQHPNVASIQEVGEMGDGSIYVVLEQLVGEPLSKLFASGRSFEQAEVFDLILQAAAGLQAAHWAGFVHGNLSPDTILVPPAAGPSAQIKLIRFPLDPSLRQARPAVPISEPAGAGYSSPERVAGQPADERSDVFSLGAVLHHLLTGRPPQSGKADGSVPKFARSVLNTALAPDPALRFQTASAFAAALKAALATADERERPNHRWALALKSVTACLVFLAAGIWLIQGLRSRKDSERLLPVALDMERVSAPSTNPQAPSALASPRSPAPVAGSRNVSRSRNNPAGSSRSPVPGSAEPAPAGADPISAPSLDDSADTSRSPKTGMVSPLRSEDAGPATMEQRARVYLRIGLDEAFQQLGRPAHAIEGMTPLFLGLARSEMPDQIDPTRPVIRSVYMGPNESLILLDQQRVQPGGQVPRGSATVWRIGDIMLHLHGDARPEVLRNFVRRVR